MVGVPRGLRWSRLRAFWPLAMSLKVYHNLTQLFIICDCIVCGIHQLHRGAYVCISPRLQKLANLSILHLFQSSLIFSWISSTTSSGMTT